MYRIVSSNAARNAAFLGSTHPLRKKHPLGQVATGLVRKLGETELMRSLSLSHAVSEAELGLGDHVYCWREGYTYAHHCTVYGI